MNEQAALPGFFGTTADVRLTEPDIAPDGEVLLAIDPGTKRSAWVAWDGVRVLSHGCVPNEELLEQIDGNRFAAERMAVEMVASYGMPVGREVFETVLWIGRFIQAWVPDLGRDRPHRLVYRRDVKLHLCGSMRANDATVRQAVLDRFGGKAVAVGRKAAPGPLYGLHGDEWSALAVAITAAETER